MLLPFDKQEIKRRPRIKRMKVYDCGVDFVLMKCEHCGYDNGWQQYDSSITELKKGWPCPVCNKQTTEVK